MEGPFYARYCNLTGDEKGLDDVAGQLAKVFELFRDPVTGLLYHGMGLPSVNPTLSKQTLHVVKQIQKRLDSEPTGGK